MEPRCGTLRALGAQVSHGTGYCSLALDATPAELREQVLKAATAASIEEVRAARSGTLCLGRNDPQYHLKCSVLCSTLDTAEQLAATVWILQCWCR